MTISEHEAFDAAVGRMILTWAEMEGCLYSVFVHYSGMSDPVARAVLSGTRASGLISYLEAIFANKNIDPPGKLRSAIEQTRSINAMRDWIAHNGSRSIVTYKDDTVSVRVTSNAERVARYAKTKELAVSVQMLEDMVHDLEWICACYQEIFLTPVLGEMEIDGERLLQPVELPPWRYKSPSPERNSPRWDYQQPTTSPPDAKAE